MTGGPGSLRAKNLPPSDPYGQLRRAGELGASYSQLSILAKRGAAVRLAPALYVVGATLPSEQVVRHHVLSIISGVWPGGVLCARTAFAGGMPIDGKLFVSPADSSQRRQPMTLPGLTIVLVEGPPNLPGDMTMPGGLFLSGTARGLVENASVRGRPAMWRAGTAAVEDKIDELARTGGAGRIQAVLDQLDVITGSFDPAPVALVRSRLAAVLGSFSSSIGVPESARLAARLSGVPFDAHRIAMLTDLVTTLENTPPRPRHLSPPISRWEWLPFFEAYFSNFIEGTEFGVEEARLIAVEGVVPVARPADAYDVAATYHLAIDPVGRGRVPHSGTELVELLRERHATLMAARPDKTPGELKTVPNFAGGYQFVQPELVVGTLKRGFEEVGRLVDPFARALATMVLVTECHPFLDGNGRVARLALNAELSAAGQVRICIPTVFRPEYLSALVGYSGGAGQGQSLISVLTYAHRWTAEIDWSSFGGANQQVAASNGYLDPDVASRTGQRLLLPSGLPMDASND
ncbi:MAG: Fic family protein [Sporichthyaceae bacterium]|nr:Fic family protein [Sporichthyaceae bacterium]